MSYLDYNGLKRYDQKIKGLLDGKGSIAVGYYSGSSNNTGQNSPTSWRTISLPFTPTFVLVLLNGGFGGTYAGSGASLSYLNLGGMSSEDYTCLVITNNGFKVRNYYGNGGCMNYKDQYGSWNYMYLAIK